MKALRLVGGVLVLSASTAWADIPPPDVSGCNGKEVGAACRRDDGSPGACAKSTCTRNDYSEGPPPKTVNYECLRCTAGAAPAPVPDAGTTEGKKSSCTAAPALSLAALTAWLLVRRRKRERA
ncbi:MAG: hypothetical protein AB1938_25445 [Myxococcota bacterium]